jgi:ribosome recycling factor
MTREISKKTSKLTNNYTAKIDELLAEKEKDITKFELKLKILLSH